MVLELGFVVKFKNGWYVCEFFDEEIGEMICEEKFWCVKDINCIIFWGFLFKY